MNIKLYQINLERDSDNVAFMSYETLPKLQGTQDIKSEIYDLVFEGDVPCKHLEDVYRMFNVDHPKGYMARSLSKSDVVEIEGENGEKNTFHYCDSFGYQEVDFNPDKCQISDRFLKYEPSEQIRVLLVKPGEYPKEVLIGNSLEDMQAVVGGDIEEYMPFEDEVAIVCNEEGKMLGLALNRAVYAEPETVEMTYREMKDLFRENEKNHGKPLTGYIVFSQDSFTSPYSEKSRTYAISSDNKAFNCKMGGYSIFGGALDGSERGVRLDYYMADERGGKDGWKIERCYIKEDKHEMIDIMAGDFFIAYAPISSEKFLSMPDDLMKKYHDKFKYPEQFFRTDDGINAMPYRPSKDKGER